MGIQKKSDHPPKWLVKLYRILAGGLWADEWVAELLEAFAEVLATEGEDAAHRWLTDELAHTVNPRLVLLAYRIFRLVLAMRRSFKKRAQS